tara:strand:- start:200 stop:943 length:744 start_codon:yes stop_codon:yes gene_type:complete
MSNWGRSPRGGAREVTVEACNAWRETIDAEKEHRRRSQARLGMRPSPRATAPETGAMRSTPPSQFAQQFASPRSTAKEATVMAKQPGRPPLEQFIPSSSDVPNKANNRQKIIMDYNFESGDHQIFPPVGALEDPRQGRLAIRELKAQVTQEKQARRQAESRLQWHQEFNGDAECTIEALMRRYAVPKRLLDVSRTEFPGPMPSPRVEGSVPPWLGLADPSATAALQSPRMQQPVGFSWIAQVDTRRS